MSALDRMSAVEEDIRAALEWCLQPASEASRERRDCGYALLGPMNRYWYRFGYAAEGRGWHDRALRIVEEDEAGDSVLLLDALHGMAVLALQQDDVVPATEALERALEMAVRMGDVSREARECNSLGIARRNVGDTEGAFALVQRSIALARQIGNPDREATALSNMVFLYMDTGDYAAAVDAGRLAVTADLARDDPWGVAINEINLVFALLNAEGPGPAYEQVVQVAAGAVALEDVELSLTVLDSLAAVWAGLGNPERAARLLGVSDCQRELSGIHRNGPDQTHLDRFIGPARRSVAASDWDRSYTAGTSLSIEEAVAEGMEDESAVRSLAGAVKGPT